MSTKAEWQPDIDLCHQYIQVLEEQILLIKKTHAEEVGRLHEEIGALKEEVRKWNT